MQPGKEAFHDPAALVATQGATILERGSVAPGVVWGDELDTEGRSQLGVQRVTVVGAVADQARRVVRDEPVVERGADEPNFMW